MICLDRNTGKVIWEKTVREETPHEGKHGTNSFSSYSPVTDGEHVWVSFGSRGLYCFDLDGNPKWSKELAKMETSHGFGEGSSPALAGDAVIVVQDHEGQSKVSAFNKVTGRLLWEKDRDEGTNWSTPVAVEVDGAVQVIISGTNFIRGYDAKTGDLVWRCGGQTANVIPTPLIGFGKVFCASGYRGNALQAIHLGRKGDLSGTDAIAWEINENTPYVSSPLLADGKIYLLSSNRAKLSCYDAQTGKQLFSDQTLEGLGNIYASPLGAAGRIYISDRNGATIVLKQSAAFEVLASNTLDDGFDASPIVVGDELYLKGRNNLYCIAKQ